MDATTASVVDDDRPWWSSPQTMSAVIVFVTFVLIGLWSTQTIETGGDAALKWLFAREGAATLELFRDFRAHGLRWSINIPNTLLILMFGDRPSLYYVGPVMCFALSAAMIWLLSLRCSGPAAGLVALVAFAICEEVRRGASQSLPGIYGAAYMSTAAFLFLLAPKRRRGGWLVLAASVFIFFGYGAKVTNLFLVPGALLWLALLRERRLLVVCLITLAVLYLVETGVLFLLMDGNSGLGRPFVLNSGTHMQRSVAAAGSVPENPPRFINLPNRWVMLRGNMTYVVYAFFAACALSVPWPRLRTVSGRLVLLMGFSFCLIVTFFVVRLTPMTIGVPKKIMRYYVVLLPFTAVGAGMLVGALVQPLERWMSPGFKKLWPSLAALAAAGCVMFYNHTQYPRKGYRLTTVDDHFGRVRQTVEEGCGVHYGNLKAARAVRFLVGPLWRLGHPGWEERAVEVPRGVHLLARRGRPLKADCPLYFGGDNDVDFSRRAR